MWRYTLAPPDTSTSSNHFDILDRWSTSGPDGGHRTFLYGYKKYNRGSGRKRTNERNEQHEPGVDSKCKTRSYVTHCIPVSIYRLTLAKILQPMRSADSSWLVFPHCSGPHLIRLVSLLSGVDCPVRRPSPTPSSQSLCLTLFSRSLTHFRSRRYLESQNPLSGFAPKQTKESSAWRTSYIVLH